MERGEGMERDRKGERKMVEDDERVKEKKRWCNGVREGERGNEEG